MKTRKILVAVLLLACLSASLLVPIALGQTTAKTGTAKIEVKAGLELLVNATAALTDDYVPLQKTGDVKAEPHNTPPGDTDNSIPLKIKLKGATGATAMILLSSSTTGGEVVFKKSDGTAYPAEGVEATVGTDLDVRLYGKTASTALKDVTITAKTSKTGDQAWTATATVIWVPKSSMVFRGSNSQGQALSIPESEADLRDTARDKLQQKVGSLLPQTDGKDIHNQCETKFVIQPNAILPNVEWRIVRYGSAAGWYNNEAKVVALGGNAYEFDGPNTHGYDMDWVQDSGSTSLFCVDVPGYPANPINNTDTVSHKGSFAQWVEVKIGGMWYVCSACHMWHTILHAKSNATATGWVARPGKVNEIVEGMIPGFANDWNEEDPVPTVTGIEPATGVNTDPARITTVAGTNFANGATVKLTKDGQADIVATSVAFVSATELTCTFNLTNKAVGQWNVVVQNMDNPTAGTLANGFTVTTPP